MESIWEILKIEQTNDIRAIRRAYGIMAAKYNPEEHPEEFLRVRKAYEQALAAADEHGSTAANTQADLPDDRSNTQNTQADSPDNRGSTTANTQADSSADLPNERNKALADSPDDRSNTQNTQADSPTDPPDAFHWNFTEEAAPADTPAIRKFRELYLGKRKKDRNAWSDYFLSADFLAVYRDPDFLSAMLNTVQDNLESNPPAKEFLTELYITYGLTESRTAAGRIEPEEGAAFDGIEYVLKLAETGPVIKRFKGNDEAMRNGFRDYRQLLRIAAREPEADEEQLLLGKIVDRYTLSNISDKPIQNAWQYELSQRHPKSIRLLSYFFANQELPEKAYQIVWDHLHLNNTLYGKEKLLYGELKEAVLSRTPAVAEKPKPDYQKLTNELSECRAHGAASEIDRLFAREDFQAALLDLYFVEQKLLKYFIMPWDDPHYINRLEEFYTSHPNAPLRGQLFSRIRDWRNDYRVKQELKEDNACVPEHGLFDFTKRAYVRYYLNAGFHRAKGLNDYQADLADVLVRRLPASPEWTKKLLDPETGAFPAGKPAVSVRFDEDVLEIFFYPKHLAYRWNGKDYGPCYPWELLQDATEELFWLLLPIAQAPFAEHEAVNRELCRRLSALLLHPEDAVVIADCITGKICRLESEADDYQPYFTFYEELGERLLGCDVYRNGEMVFFEETENGEQLLPTGQYQAQDMEMASVIARRIFGELRGAETSDAFPLPERMPTRLLLKNQWGSPSVIEGSQLTEEILLENLKQFFAGKRVRVELDWNGAGSLVFRKEGRLERYLCMYFDHQAHSWNALIAQPEVYAVIEDDQIQYTPFGLGMLPDYLIHQNTYSIQSRLKDIFDQLGRNQPKPQPGMWDSHVHRIRKELRYHYDMRVYGDFSPEQTKNPLTADFDFAILPSKLLWTDPDGRQQEHMVNARRDAMLVQDRLRDYMSGRLASLCLSWQMVVSPEDAETAKAATAAKNASEAATATTGNGSENVTTETGNGSENVTTAAGNGSEAVAPQTLPVRSIELLRDQNKHRMLYADELCGSRQWLVSNVGEYLDAEGKKYRKETFLGKTVPGYLVHEDLERIRGCLDLLLPVIDVPDRIVTMFGEFAPDPS